MEIIIRNLVVKYSLYNLKKKKIFFYIIYLENRKIKFIILKLEILKNISLIYY